MTEQELRKMVVEQIEIEKLSRDEMVDLLGECEFALFKFKGRINQLHEKGLKGLYNIITGINRRNKQAVLDDIYYIQKISLEIQIILMKKVNIGLSELNKKLNTTVFWTNDIVDRLSKKLSEIDVSIKLLRWQNNVRHKKTEDGRKYINVPDGMKVLLIVSDLYDIVHNRTDFIEYEALETVKENLELSDQMYVADFYETLINEKCFSLYIKKDFSYNDEDVSEEGYRIKKIENFYLDEHMKEYVETQKASMDDMCRATYVNKLRNGRKISTVELCQILLDDLARLYSKYQEIEGPDDPMPPLPEPNGPQDDRQDEPEPPSLLDPKQTKYSILRLTPEGSWLFKDGNISYEKIDRKRRDDWAYVFPDEVEESKKLYLDSNTPDIVTVPTGYFGKSKSEIKEFLLNKTWYLPLADYYMYLWFRAETSHVQKNQKVAFIDYYDRYLSVSGYEINASGDGYRKLFSDLEIHCSRLHDNINKDIRDKFKKSTLLKGNMDILMYRTFYVKAHIIKQLEEIGVKEVDDAWEKILKTDNAALGEIIQAMEKNYR